MRQVRGNDELEWLYQQSPADIGFSGIDYRKASACSGGLVNGLAFRPDRYAKVLEATWLTPPPPSPRKLRAAARTYCYRLALRELTVGQQAAIERAYELRNLNGLPDVRGVDGGPELMAEWGLAALLVRDTLVRRVETERAAEIAAAQASWHAVEVSRKGGRLDLVEAQAAATEARAAWRAEQAKSVGAAKAAARLLDDALRAYEAIRRRHRDEAREERKTLQAECEGSERDAAIVERKLRADLQLAGRLGVSRRELAELGAALWMAHAELFGGAAA